MRKAGQIRVAGAALALAAIGGFLFYRHARQSPEARVIELVERMPADATTMAYMDATALRESAFFRGLLALAPTQQADADYVQFLRATGFNYERDLDRAALAFWQRGAEKLFFAVVEGRFDEQKIAGYALKSGTRMVRDGREIFSTPVSGSTQRVSFAFLAANRLALTNDADLAPFLRAAPREKMTEWRERALRLAGSPFFLIVRQEALLPLAQRPPAPGGVRMDQLSTVIANLRWVTLAARPDGEQMRLVAEGECISEDVARQMAETLDGLLMVARIALDDPKTRKEMNPVEHEALVETLKSADVSRIGRGETKSVRVVLEAGPKLLAAVRGK